MSFVHDISLAALAAAVMTLGLVMLLELRALAQLRRSVDGHLSRVFEQLDLLRFDYAQLLEEQPVRVSTEPPRVTDSEAVAGARPKGAHGSAAARLPGAALASGEARLLASLAEARARRGEALRANGTSAPR